jgi:hypothetical protein
VADEVAATMAQASTLQGTVTLTSYNVTGDPLASSYTFLRSENGSFRVTAINGGYDAGYDAVTGTRRQVSVYEGRVTLREETGMPPAGPDPSPTEDVQALVFLGEFGKVVTALRAAGEVRVEEETIERQPVWIFEADITADAPGGPEAADHLRVVIDKASAVPVEITRSAGGEPLESVRLEGVVVGEPIPPEALAVPVPEGAAVATTDYGFERLESVGDVAAEVGYPAATPVFLPDGFQLAELAVALAAGDPISGVGSRTGRGGANPASIGVVSIVYRRGLEELVVTIRRAGDPDLGTWSDPFGTDGLVTEPVARTLGAGRFINLDVEVLVDPNFVPHLWGVNTADDFVLTVAGSVTAEELVQIAESLR